jgi:hypothetical protein
MPAGRNNRIIGANFLNRTCAYGARLESILLVDTPKNLFATASVNNGVIGPLALGPLHPNDPTLLVYVATSRLCHFQT